MIGDIKSIVEFQAKLQGVANSISKEMVRTLNASDQALLETVRDGLAKPFSGKDIKEVYKRLERLCDQVYAIRKKAIENAKDVLIMYEEDVAEFSSKHAANYCKGITKRKVKPLSKKRVNDIVQFQPFQGRSIENWFNSWKESDKYRIISAIQQAVNNGITPQKAIDIIRGTKTNGYKDGVLNVSRSSASMIARTITNGVSNEARLATLDENEDVIDGIQFLATLDGRTSFVCASLDGKIWRNNERDQVKRPPLHPNCRSTLIPYIELRDRDGNIIEDTTDRAAAAEDFVQKAKERYEANHPGKKWDDLAATTRDKYYYKEQEIYDAEHPDQNIANGKGASWKHVSASTTFKDYLESQPEDFQRSWLGEKRFELYKEGKLKFENLVNPDSGYTVPVSELDKLPEKVQKTLDKSDKIDIIKKDTEEVTINSIEKMIESLKSDFRDLMKDPGHSSKDEDDIIAELGRVLKVKEDLLAAQKEQDEKRAAEIAEQERKKQEEEKAKEKAALEKQQKEEAERLEALRKKKEDEVNKTLDIDSTKIPLSKEELEKMIANREPVLEPSDDCSMNAFYAPEAIEQRRKAIQEITEKMKKDLLNDASRLGISVEEFIERCEEKIKKELENAGLYRRIDHEDLFKVLDSGRFKSQFETGTSGGTLNTKLRSSAEFNMFGYEDDVNENKTECPIYGYLDYKDKPIGQSTEGTDFYGDCIVQFKEDVKKRTTFCSTDSLSPGQKKEVACSSILNPNVTTMRYNLGDYLDSDERLIVPEGKTLEHARIVQQYTEAQFHGELTVDDIECVFIKQRDIDDQKINERQIQRLKDKGLIVEIIK